VQGIEAFAHAREQEIEFFRRGGERRGHRDEVADASDDCAFGTDESGGADPEQGARF